MSVALKSKFFANARGVTLKDSASVTWTINANTNEISATATGGAGGVTSVGLSDGSTTPVYAISGSPVTSTGTLTFSLKNQNANIVLAGPTSGGAAQPTFRALVAADIPALAYVTSVGLADGSTSPIYSITGSPVTSNGTLTFTLATQSANLVFAGPTTGAAAQPTFRALVAADVPSSILPGSFSGFANPTAKVALAAANGVATTAMRSDGAPALDVTISPTWTGNHIFTPGSGVGAIFNGASASYAARINGNSSSGNSLGLLVEAGTTSADTAVNVTNQTGATRYFRIVGDGSGNLGPGAAGLSWTSTGALTQSTTLAVGGLLSAQAGLTVTTATTTLTAGTTTVAPLKFLSGTNLTAAAAGTAEYDGTSHYFTNETTSGRGLVPVEQFFHLASDGGGITTIANFFGTTSNISLVSGAYYEIEIVCFFVMGSTGSVITWSLINSAAPTSMDMVFEMSPVTGVVAPPGTATLLSGQIVAGANATTTVVTTSLTASSSQYARFRIMLKNGTGTSLKIQVAETTTTTALTPKIGSYWRCKRIPAGNVGTFAA